MVIITGLGRCGTSILTKYLGEVGFGLGRNINWHDEVRAGYELSTFYSIVREMWNNYCKAGKPIDLDYEYRGPYWKCTYREAILNVDNDKEKQGEVEVIKDPRITWHPDIIEALWTIRQDFKLIICHRNIEDVMASRKSLPPQYDDPKRVKLSEYKEDFADFFTKVLELKIPYKLLFFPDFIHDYYQTWRVLNSMTIGLKHDFNKSKEIWDKMMDKKLIAQWKNKK